VADLDPIAPALRMPIAEDQAYRIEIGRNMLSERDQLAAFCQPRQLDFIPLGSFEQPFSVEAIAALE
jgi:hypothetical protein